MTLDEARGAILNALAVKTQEHLALTRLAESIEFVTGQAQQVQALQVELAGLKAEVTDKQTELGNLSDTLLERTQLAQDELAQARLAQEAHLKEEASQANLARSEATRACEATLQATQEAGETLTRIRQDTTDAKAAYTTVTENLQLVRAERDKVLLALTTV